MSSQFPTPLHWYCCHLPKRGNSDEELEDAYAVSAVDGRFAVADGATEAVCSDIWARLLVTEFIAAPVQTPEQWTDSLARMRQAWWSDVRQRTLPWYAEHKLEQGAAATFVVLHVHPTGDWAAVAVGDSCLFHLRGDTLLRAFPLESSHDFNNRPPLVRSCLSPPELPQQQSPAHELPLPQIIGSWELGDRFLLMTDALAQWFLQGVEQQAPVLDSVRRLVAVADDRQRLETEINELRVGQHLRNDDVTLLVVEMSIPRTVAMETFSGGLLSGPLAPALRGEGEGEGSSDL